MSWWVNRFGKPSAKGVPDQPGSCSRARRGLRGAGPRGPHPHRHLEEQRDTRGGGVGVSGGSGQRTPTPDLAGLLARRSPTRPAAATPIVRPPLSELEDDSRDRRPVVHADSSAPTANAGTTPRPRVYLQSITVYLPRTLAEQLADAASAAGLTRTAFLLKAVNATHAKIVDAEQETGRPEQAAGDLFAVPQADRTSRPPSVQTTTRVTDEQLAVLNRLATQVGVHRSRVIAASLEMYLGAGSCGETR